MGYLSEQTRRKENVLIAFQLLTECCQHKKSDDPDCYHPEQEFNHMLCCPANCPLLLEDN